MVGLAIGLQMAVGSSGCDSARSSPSVIRVGGVSINKRSVDHWAAVIARGAIVANLAGPRQSPKQQAIALLISSSWLSGEASRLGLRPSHGQLARLVEQQERSMANGPSEFKEMLSSSGETATDVEFEARARWDAAALARRLSSTVERQSRAQVSNEAIARFYHAQSKRYHLRERRYYDLIERLPSKAAAVALAKRVGTGERFAERASKERPFRPETFAGLPGQKVAYRAVFSAKVGVLMGPVPLQGAYALFVLRRIVPARVQPLSEVRGSIERKLLASAERQARARAVGDFHRRWLAQTDCRPGYVMQKCRQYLGRRTPERDPFTGY